MAAFKRRWDGYGSGQAAEEMREEDVNNVIADFLNDGAPHQAFTADARAVAIVHGTSVSRDMFDELQGAAREAMQRGVFPRFAASTAGAQLERERPDLVRRASEVGSETL